jgi:serine/threonine protein phosphatase PrpC
MEDTYCIHDQGRFIGVFDGHGGAGVSTYLSSSIFEKLEKHLEMVSSSPLSPSIKEVTRSLSAALNEIEDEVLEKDDFQYQGSTAVAVYVHENPKSGERTIISANVGDSRAVLSRGSVAVSLTRDHKPDDMDEKKRILAMGETIEWDSYCNVSRVRNLSLSRAIGDRFAKPVVSAEPEIKLFPLKDFPVEEGYDRNDFIVLASDGLWDVMTSQNCVNFVMERLTPSNQQAKHMSPSELERQISTRRKRMSRDLADEAIRRGSCDNVCVVILWLNN